ncbi:MAG: FKBP-type peptidyl-prolyl cis-trans isomerase [Akkermansiaceae bacterium]|nr:FKBP-type peptidyl-prolyl cis-trans isomerase [Akkermansiaceae bacterium]
MKTRDFLVILGVIVVAGLLVFKKDAIFPMDEGGRAEASDSGSPMRSARGQNGTEEDGITKSDRKLRESLALVTTDSGLQYQILKEGEGESPSPTSKVEVHYVGTLDDGTVFDSSRDRGESASFGLNQVIKGWTEGLQLMRPGGLYVFTISPELGYGSQKMGESIPPNSILTFEVELLSVSDE